LLDTQAEGNQTLAESYAYTADGQLQQESQSQIAANVSVHYTYTAVGNPSTMQLQSGSAPLTGATYDYTSDPDNSQRLDSVTDAHSNQATYTYDPDTGQITTMTQNGLTTAYDFDPATGNLDSVTTTNNSTHAVIYKASYTYGDPTNPSDTHVDQRTREDITQQQPNGSTTYSYIVFTYDTYNQLATATTYPGQYDPNATSTPTPTSTETFTFDANGNHTDGTDAANGTDGFATNSTLAAMNEYSSYTAPCTTTALPLSYNPRGDLTCDGKFNYTYDAEDRMTSAESVTLSSAAVKLTFTYDSESRRTSETVWSGYNTVTMTYATSTTTTFAYNGDEMIAEFDANGHMTESFTWGVDISGTLDGAGGIGGLLSITTYSATGAITGTYHPFYDGNGNVMGLTDTSNQTVATYTYSAFGSLTASTWSGPAGTSDPNPFHFSTRYQQKLTGILEYPHDHDDEPALEIWTTRDKVVQTNPNELLGDDPINRIDVDGREDKSVTDWDNPRPDRNFLTKRQGSQFKETIPARASDGSSAPYKAGDPVALEAVMNYVT